MHTTGLDPTHAPDWQASVWVHALPSLQPVPSAATGFGQVPLLGSQVPCVWHWSLAVHVTGLEPVQVPDEHTSVCVHALPSLQPVPSAAGGLEHAPVLVLHVPAVWH